MNSSGGEIEANPDRLEELFEAIANELAHDSARLAIWSYRNLELSQFNCKTVGAESPLVGSNSKLAGFGFLIQLEPAKTKPLIDAIGDRLGGEISHIEIESQGSVQFRAYDGFECTFFGDRVSVDLLEDLKTREVICSYTLVDREQ